MLSKRERDWIDLFGHLFFLFPFVAVDDLPRRCRIFLRSYQSGEVSSTPAAC